jgi:hypothetical protein
VIAHYILTLGIVLVLAGVLEISMPLRAFVFWRRWSSSRFFFFHGILLIAAGFPLTLYEGPLSPVIFTMGLLAALTGPFVLIYPEKFRMIFSSVGEEMKNAGIKKMVYVEGFVRIAAGILCAAAYFLGRQ